MRKLIPVLLLTFCGSAAFSQSSLGSDRTSDNSNDLFAESLRAEIVSDIKKRLSTDSSLQRSQTIMSDMLKASGVHPTLKVPAKADMAAVYKSSPITLANILHDFARTFMVADEVRQQN